MSTTSASLNGRRGRVVAGVPSSSVAYTHTSLLSYMVGRLPVSPAAVSCLCLQVLKPKYERTGNQHSSRVQSEWHVSMRDGSIVRVMISTDMAGVGWRVRVIGGWPRQHKLSPSQWRSSNKTGGMWSAAITRMGGHSVPGKLAAEVTAAREYLNGLDVQPHGALCTVLLFHTQQNTWMDAGPGFCSLRGRQLAVRNKLLPSSFVMQQTIGDNTFYQQDGHSLLLFAMGPRRSNDEDQVMALVFDSRRRIDNVASRLANKTGRPVPNYAVCASPHANADHVCTRLRVTIMNRETGERMASGLACFESSTNCLTVWFEYDGHPSNFIRFTHRLNLAARADYHYVSNGVFTLGNSAYTLTSERPGSSDRHNRARHIDAERRLWQSIEDGLQALSVAQLTRSMRAAALRAAAAAAAKAVPQPVLIEEVTAVAADEDVEDYPSFADELAAAAADDESCHISQPCDDDMDLENDEKAFATHGIANGNEAASAELRASLLWCTNDDTSLLVKDDDLCIDLEPECPVQQAPRIVRPTILKRRRSPSTDMLASDAPTSPTSSTSSDDDDEFESNDSVLAAKQARDRRLCTTPPRVKNNGSCSRALDAAITCISSLLP